jgi:uncharacterized lipoprotein YmbA
MKLSVTYFSLLACLTLFLSSGCLNIGKGDVQPTLYYTLEPVDASPLADAPAVEPLVVGLERIEVPQYLDRREIVVRTGSNELRYTERHLWAERPSDSLQRLLSMNIERQSSSPLEIHGLPWPDYSNPEWVVYLNIESFEGQESPDTELLLEVSWTIQSTKHGTIAAQGHYKATNLNWAKGNYSSLARGLSKGLTDLGRLIAKDLEEIHAGNGN